MYLWGFIFLKTVLLLIVFFRETKKDLNKRLINELEKGDEIFIYGELPPHLHIKKIIKDIDCPCCPVIY